MHKDAQGTKASRCLWVRSIERERLYILYTSSHKVQCLCLSLNKYCILLPPNSPNPFDLVHVCALTDLIKKDPHPPPKKSYLLLNTCFFLFLAWWKGEKYVVSAIILQRKHLQFYLPPWSLKNYHKFNSKYSCFCRKMGLNLKNDVFLVTVISTFFPL